jgi:hypothetical protein
MGKIAGWKIQQQQNKDKGAEQRREEEGRATVFCFLRLSIT